MTLNTFHFAGVSSKSNVTRGVPRLKELLHISKNIKSPSTNIYLKDEIKYDKTKATNVLNVIELTSLKDLVKSINIYFDPDDDNTVVEKDQPILDIYKIYNELDNAFRDDTSGSDWVIRFEFDKQDLINKNITMEDIYHKINLKYGDDINCVYSDDNSNNLVFRIRIMKFKKLDPSMLNDLNIIKDIAHEMRDSIIIKGVNGINAVSMYKNNQNYEVVGNDYIQKDEWVLNTSGLNLLELFTNNDIDCTKTYSNDIYEIYETLGIEAAREVLMKEIYDVIVGSGNYVNHRHLALLGDIMTNRGALMSPDRFGINRNNIGPLAKCSFEETTDQLFKASIFGEVDNLSGVSSNIMMGQIPKCGTGDSEIIIDETELLNIPGDEEYELDDLDQWVKSDYCTENVGIEYNEEGIEADNIEDIPMPEIEL